MITSSYRFQHAKVLVEALPVPLKAGVNGEVAVEERPLTLDVFEQPQLPGLVVQATLIFPRIFVAVAQEPLAAVLASQLGKDLVDRSLDELWLLHGKRRKPDHRQKGGVGLFGERFPRQHRLEVLGINYESTMCVYIKIGILIAHMGPRKD